MVADGTQYFQWWWIGTFPGLAIFTVVLAFNFLGDSLRDVFDPRTGYAAPERHEPARGRRAARAAAGGGRLLTVVDGVDYRVEQGEVFGVAGESGSGKTMSMLALLGVLPDGAAVEGRVLFDGRDLLGARRGAPARARRARPRDGLPGPDDVAPSDAHGRPPADRARPAATSASTAAPPRAARSSCSSRCGSPTGPRRCARTRTSSRAGCASGSRSRSRSPAGRSC